MLCKHLRFIILWYLNENEIEKCLEIIGIQFFPRCKTLKIKYFSCEQL